MRKPVAKSAELVRIPCVTVVVTHIDLQINGLQVGLENPNPPCMRTLAARRAQQWQPRRRVSVGLNDTDEAKRAPVRRGWCLDSEAFRKEMLERMEGQLGEHHAGELKLQGWTEGELAVRRKSDPAKVVMAQRLRAETMMTLERIARRPQMGTKTHLVHLMYWEWRKGIVQTS